MKCYLNQISSIDAMKQPFVERLQNVFDAVWSKFHSDSPVDTIYVANFSPRVS